MTSFWLKPFPNPLFVWAMLISPAVSLTCTSQNFTGRERYPQCLDLLLDSYLHYSYNAGDATLAVVFSAKPPNPAGWTAWGINPRGLGMIGTQTLVAYRDLNGTVVANTYRIDSYELVVRSNLSMDVRDLKTEEYFDGGFRIFAKIRVPENLAAAKKVYQVWQVGAGVTDAGQLGTHEFEAENLGAMSKLSLAVKADCSLDIPAGSPALAGNSLGHGRSSSGGSRIGVQNAAFYWLGPIIGIFLALL